MAAPRTAGEVLRRAFRIFSERGARFLGAAVAFYALLSAAPLFVVVLRVCGALLGKQRAESALWSGLAHWMAPEGLETIRALTERIDRAEGSASALGVVVMVYGSTRLFRALRRALNQLWGIDLRVVDGERSVAKRYAWRYGSALGLTAAVTVLVLLLALAKGGVALAAKLGERAGATLHAMLLATDGITSVALTFVLFLVLVRALVEKPIAFRHAAISAAVSTALFAVGSWVVTIYIRHKQLGDLYEGATAMVVAVLWVYYSAQVFFFGACVGAALDADATERTIGS